MKRIIYAFIFFLLLVAGAYLLQPLKKGEEISMLYHRKANWPQLPPSFVLGNPTAIAVDTDDHVFVFHRGKRTWPLLGEISKKKIPEAIVLMLDQQSGKIITEWGDHCFSMPHGLTVDRQQNIWITDVGLHQVIKFSHKGKRLLTLGEEGVAGDDKTHFNKPTGVAVAPDGSFYVSDGYGNSRIVKFASDGKYLFEWGTKGKENGQFRTPHGIDLDRFGNVYVADRDNSRIQVFDSTGKFLRLIQGNNMGNVCAVHITGPSGKMIAVDDVSFLKIIHRGSDVILCDSTGKPISRFGRSTMGDGLSAWYHDVAIDKDGDVYVCDIKGNTIQKFIRK